MAIIDSGTYTCKCGKCYNWVYYDTAKDDGQLITDFSPSAIAVKSYVNKGDQIEITVSCPVCGEDNVFYKTLG